ncbi:hypothetical protein [Flavobacterium beibuense]|uniref:hypothetical protein n=1 Tax=Flavobacterium beibuense TaxID=657326 RepID=UPI0018DC554C|nr:hypothetical protein [Flavobacterium beibuense]
MKYPLLPLIISICLISCNNTELEKLNRKISSLEKQNDSLINIISKSELEKAKNTQLYLIPKTFELKSNKANIIEGILSEIQEYPEFELHYYNEANIYDDSNKIEYEKTGDNKFEFEYIPKENSANQEIKVVVIYKVNNSKINLFGITNAPVK